jgi:hypothetical protein
MKALTTPEGNIGFKTLTSIEGTSYTICDDGRVYWKDRKNPEWHSLCGDIWASLFEDETFYEAYQTALTQWKPNKEH